MDLRPSPTTTSSPTTTTEIRCKRCPYRGTIDDFPLKLNGTDRTTACATCVYKNREERRVQRMKARPQDGQAREDEMVEEAQVNDNGDLKKETTLASAVASSSTTIYPHSSTTLQTTSTPAATTTGGGTASSSRKDKTRRNVGRSAFPEIQTTWHAFTRLITPRNPGDPIDVHAAVILRGIPMFDPFLAIQTDREGSREEAGVTEGAEGGERYVLLDGKREKVETAAWMLARIVAREIWRITGYRFIYKSRSGSTGNPTRHNSHFNCAQNDAEKKNKRSRVSIQKKRMSRFDCGGYLNIITDERDLGTVNVVITHMLDHVRYAERPEAVDVHEAPWLVGLDSRAEGGMALDADTENEELQWDMDASGPSSRRSVGGEAGATEEPRNIGPASQTLYELSQRPSFTPNRPGQIIPLAAGPVQSPSTTPNGNIVLDPRLAGNDSFNFLSEASQNAGPSSATGIPSTLTNRRVDAAAASSHSLQPSTTLNSVTSALPQLGVQHQGTMLLSDMVVDQLQQQPTRDRNTASASGTAHPERVHITPDEYLRYQQAYQVILSQLTSSRGMDAKRYEKVGPMLQWIEQVAKIFEGESSGGKNGNLEGTT
ncbi:hypothetical protein QFC22_000010 [Naganishia vaughanmartiniae]|uniref:Uncharacterized protein n=1 Tax=Naganishia vaughanmartiniae TaxID=1424756 RepID=A0ACC2XQS6_9TREE|nr:hypothetical protein QFC22_000010 [Naganishia vaughanmartiniae]